MKSIVEKICEFAENTPEKIAVVLEGKEASYAELWKKTVRLAHLYKKRNVPEGGRIILQCKYDPFYIAGIYAAHLCGAAVIPIDKDANSDMISKIYERTDGCLVVSNCRAELPNCIRYDELDELLDADTSLEGLAFPEPESIGEIMFTTGTTGAPKGVQFTQRNMTSRAISRIQSEKLGESEVGITLVPLNHVAPMLSLDAILYCGNTWIFVDGMTKVKLMFDYMDKYHVTSMYIPPAGITLLQRLAKDRLGKYSGQLRKVKTGSAAMTKDQQDYMRKMLPNAALIFNYASSESGTVTQLRYDLYDKDITCCGTACYSVDMRIVDENFTPVPAGQIGLITMKSDMNMPGYYKQPELTGKVLRDGYFVSSDLGYLDEEGFLYVTGRKDDIINVGGLKVYPSEIENAALGIQGIDECICFGIPDEITGRAVKLLIRTNEHFSGTVAHIQEELSKVMDYYKVPKSIEIVEKIEKTANGKPNRKFYQNMVTGK